MGWEFCTEVCGGMLRVLILDIPEIRVWQESEFLEQGFGFQSGQCSRKADFFIFQGQIFTSFEVQKFPAESFSNKYWFFFSLSFRVDCNSPSLSCPWILSYGCQFMLVPLIVRKTPKSLTLSVRVLNRLWRKCLFLRSRAPKDKTLLICIW